MREFNVTGLCVPDKHYMVDTKEKLAKIETLIDREKYFTINRARQYGKTTTLALLQKTLTGKYLCARISFEGLDDENFASSQAFCKTFMKHMKMALSQVSDDKEYVSKWINDATTNFDLLNDHITDMCRDKKVVLLIDEVDKASNNRVFLHFLSMLRAKFLLRNEGIGATFHSVILTGVYDVKNIKLKLMKEGNYGKSQYEGSYNSPWNIAVDFDVDMSFHPAEIETMLKQYEDDCRTGMNLFDIGQEIYHYSSGYPYLVSRICQQIEEKLNRNWTVSGVQDAVKLILAEKNTLFDDISKNLENHPELYDFIYDILIVGDNKSFQITNPIIDMGTTFGLFVNQNGRVAISNKIFETLLYNYFISKDESSRKRQITDVLQYDIVHDGRFNMELCLRKFAQHYKELFDGQNKEDVRFLERHGRIVFLSYLKPLINGKGFYHIESQFTDLRRMDIVVDYGDQQFIIELKIWHGGAEHNNAYNQLLGYLESKNASTGYLLTFDFRKLAGKQTKSEWVTVNDKSIFDVII